ncbi:MAG: hypothetical protein WEC16_00010 [Anaerolineales bacterium]
MVRIFLAVVLGAFVGLSITLCYDVSTILFAPLMLPGIGGDPMVKGNVCEFSRELPVLTAFFLFALLFAGSFVGVKIAASIAAKSGTRLAVLLVIAVLVAVRLRDLCFGYYPLWIKLGILGAIIVGGYLGGLRTRKPKETTT